jgi:serine/threonine protein phosphatase PrpC
MKPGVLRGREHLGIGRIACIAEGGAAIALSRGGARKAYAHRDPNEDAAAFALGARGALLAVADGHGGAEPAEAAVEALLEALFGWTGSAGPPGDWEGTARQAMVHADRAAVARALSGDADEAGTTLAFALVRPGDDWLGWASEGDSHVFAAIASGVAELGAAGSRARFLGRASRPSEDLAPRSGSGTLRGVRAIVLATDGISERGIGVPDPAGAVAAALERGGAAASELRPLAAARALVEVALDAHRAQRAGDNVAAAVYWIG